MQHLYVTEQKDIFLDQTDSSYVLRVQDLPVEEKPREKLLAYGPKLLSMKELMAVILNTGTKKEHVLKMTSRIIKEYGESAIVSQTDPQKMREKFDIPLVKACQIVACLELGKRLFAKQKKSKPVFIRTPKQVYDHLQGIADLPKETLRGLYLDSRYRLIYEEVISVGSLTASIVHPREVFRPALEHCAVAVILAHNHPSGLIKPSAADIEITDQLVRAGKILGIDLLDHVIITKNNFSSIRA